LQHPDRDHAVSQALDPPRKIGDLAARGAARFGDAPALVESARTLSYRDLAAAVDETGALLAKLGVRPGDRVLIVNENCAAVLVLTLAAARCDAWPIPINARLSPREIDTVRAHCTPRRSFFTSAVSRDASEHAARLGGELLSLSGVGEVAVSPSDASAVTEPVSDDPAAQVAAMLYTTGTTGAPKGVMLSHRNVLFAAVSGATLRRLGPTDRVYVVLPVSHIFGLASVSMSGLLAGVALHLVPRFTAEDLTRALGEDGISVLAGVPAMHARLIDHVRRSGRPLAAPRLRFIYAGGAPLDAQLKADAEALYGQPVHNGYGLTETSPTISCTRLDAPRADLSVGPPVPDIETRIMESTGRVAASGEVGELHVRGPNVMIGYYRAPQLTAEVLDRDGWFNTGDLARQDADGNLFIVGRSKELIIRSGFNVYPVEVEGVFNQHPAVSQSAVVGRTVPGNEEVVAFVELRPGATVSADALREFVAERLSPYKQPAEIIVLPALPASSTGKVLKNELRKLAQSRVD
jgi:long-chain acyl-CoA synthetase